MSNSSVDDKVDRKDKMKIDLFLSKEIDNSKALHRYETIINICLIIIGLSLVGALLTISPWFSFLAIPVRGGIYSLYKWFSLLSKGFQNSDDIDYLDWSKIRDLKKSGKTLEEVRESVINDSFFEQ